MNDQSSDLRVIEADHPLTIDELKNKEINHDCILYIQLFNDFKIKTSYYENYDNFPFTSVFHNINFMTVEYFPHDNPIYLSFCYWKGDNNCAVIKIMYHNIIDFESRLKANNISVYSSSDIINTTNFTLSNSILLSSDILKKNIKDIKNDSDVSEFHNLMGNHLLIVGLKTIIPFFIGRLADKGNHDNKLFWGPSHYEKYIEINSDNFEKEYIKLYSFGESGFLSVNYHKVQENFFLIIEEYDTKSGDEHFFDKYESLPPCKYIPKLIGKYYYNEKIIFPILQNGLIYTLKSYTEENILSPTEKTKIIIQVLIAIHKLHSNKYFHRDINHLHILLDKDRNAYLQITAHITSQIGDDEFTNSIEHTSDIGAKYFMSPSQFISNYYTFLVDLYAFGRIIYFLAFDKPIDADSELKKLYGKAGSIDVYDHLPDVFKRETKIMEIFNICINSQHTSVYRTTALFLLFMIHQRKLYYIGTNEKEIEKLFAENYDIFLDFKNISKLPDFKYFKSHVIDEANDYKDDIEISDKKKRPGNEAFFYLGLMNQFGISYEPNLDKAVEYYEKSAKLNNMNAAFNLGLIYSTGKGKYNQQEEAFKYFMMASNLGSYSAKYNIGNIFRDQGNFEEAIKYYLEAGNDGYIDKAYYNLAIIYQNPDPNINDQDKSLEYFQKSADLGFVKAHYNSGVILYQRNLFEEAEKHLVIAGENGISDAYYVLSLIHNNSLDEYVNYLRKAAEMLNINALIKISDFYWRQKDINLSSCYLTLLMLFENNKESQLSFDQYVNPSHELDSIKLVSMSLINRRKFEELNIFTCNNAKEHFFKRCVDNLSQTDFFNFFLRKTGIETFLKELVPDYHFTQKDGNYFEIENFQDKDDMFDYGYSFYLGNDKMAGLRLLRKASKLDSTKARALLTFISYQYGLNETFFLTLKEIGNIKLNDDQDFIIFQSNDTDRINLDLEFVKKVNRKKYLHYLFLKKDKKSLEISINENNIKEAKLIKELIKIIDEKNEENKDSSAEDMYYVGKCYIKGKLIHQNIKIGEALIKKAADLGFPEACRGLAELYYCYNLYEANEKFEIAIIENYKNSANKGDLTSSIRLALFYLNGEFVKKNEELAISLIKDNLDPLSLFIYGCILFDKNDFEQAVDVFDLCQKKGLRANSKLGLNYMIHRFADFNLGYLTLKSNFGKPFNPEPYRDSYQRFSYSRDFVKLSSAIIEFYRIFEKNTILPSIHDLVSKMIKEYKNENEFINLVGIIKLVIAFEQNINDQSEINKILLDENFQILFEDILKIFKSKQQANEPLLKRKERNPFDFFCGLMHFFIGCIENQINKYSNKMIESFKKAYECGILSGILNLARIYKDNILFENQDEYTKCCDTAGKSSIESMLSLAIMHLLGQNGKQQDFDSASGYLLNIGNALIQEQINESQTNQKKKSINEKFYLGFNIP